MKGASLSAMQQAIIRYIESRLPQETGGAHIGVVNGNRVIIQNKSYAFDPTVDIYFGDGDKVCCLLPNSGNTAAIVGVY